jgi:phasin family protein
MSKQATAALEDSRTDAPVIDFMSFAQKGWPNLRVIHEHFEKAGFPAMRSYEEIRAMNKEAVDAVVKSTTVLANGVEEISRHAVTLMQESVESNMQALKAISEVQTPQDWIELQSNWSQRYMAAFLDQSAKLSGLSVRVSNLAVEPIHAHINGAISKIGKRE